MAKRSDLSFNDYTLKPDIDPVPQVTYNYVTNRLPSRVIRFGSVSGQRYEWKPGETIPVLVEDTNALRNLKLGERTCCGDANANLIFDVLEV
jgi:hypothetical protein